MSLRSLQTTCALILVTQSLMAGLGATTVVCMQAAAAPRLEVLFGWSEGCCTEHDHADAGHDHAGAGHDHCAAEHQHSGESCPDEHAADARSSSTDPHCSLCAPGRRAACECLHWVLPADSGSSASKSAYSAPALLPLAPELHGRVVAVDLPRQAIQSGQSPPPDPAAQRRRATAHVLRI